MSGVPNTPSVPEQAAKLLELKRGWDSYDGLPPDPGVIHRAVAIAGCIEHLFTAAPSLVPLSSGDIQIEWHCDGWDVEIAVERFRG